MSGFELNKIAAAVLLAGLIAMVLGKVTGLLYDGVEHHGDGHEVARGYEIEVVEGAGETTGAAEDTGPAYADIRPLLANADVAAGEDYFKKKCTTCHVGEKGGANKTGPALWNIVNRPIASKADFNYSSAMKDFANGQKWDYEHLNGFLYNPKKYIKGTIMAYAGTKKDSQRADLVAYLRTLNDAPPALPPAAAPEAPAEAAE